MAAGLALGTPHPAVAATSGDLLDVAHLVAASPGTPLPTYTLADETRPLLAGPAEANVSVTIPAGTTTPFAVDLPATVAPGDVILTGTYDTGKRTFPFRPQRVTVTDVAGIRRATVAVPPLAGAPGAPTRAALTATSAPAADVVETEAALPPTPKDAVLELAYGLSDASAIAGASPVTFEIAAAGRDDAGVLWSATLDPAQPDARRWHEVRVPLAPLAGRAARLVFRARTAAGGRATLVPLWGDPTVVAPAPRAARRRNVIVISIDTLRADHLGTYGAYRPTSPALDAFAKEAAVFTAAWSVWPETSGSHMSLFTSRFPSEHGVTSFISTPPPTIALLAEQLRAGGYRTRAFTEDGGVWAHAGFARGFGAYGERRSATGVYPGEAAATFGDATRWIEAHADRTFFLFVHTYQVHGPYTPPRAYRQLFADVPGREGTAFAGHALNYDREIRFTDDQVGAFLASLHRLGLDDRTIVILLSDHGEEFGDHGGMGHGRTLYREVLHVPLVVRAPGLATPARIATPVSLLDVAPTVLDLLGLPADRGHRGVSLAALLRGGRDTGPPADRPIYGEIDRDDLIAHDHVRMTSVRSDGRTAITDSMDGTTRCYAADDPDERRPLADCGSLGPLLTRHAPFTRPVPTAASPAPADPRTVEKMRALGYVE